MKNPALLTQVKAYADSYLLAADHDSDNETSVILSDLEDSLDADEQSLFFDVLIDEAARHSMQRRRKQTLI